MKKALLISTIFSFGLLISSCNGMLGDLLGTSNSNAVNATDSTGSGDSLHCPRHCGHHGNDHDADDSTAVKDSSVHNHIILQKN